MYVQSQVKEAEPFEKLIRKTMSPLAPEEIRERIFEDAEKVA